MSSREDATQIVKRLQDAGFKAYFAGGCVRDHLLGKAPHDFDIATDARPEQVDQLFPGKSDLVGASFLVAKLRHAGDIYDVATFRSEGAYTDHRHPDEVRPASPEEDAFRRDFTVNALFFDPIKNEVLDFVGGQADLKARILRAVGVPYDRFHEDELRLLRAVRFASTLNFEIDPATWNAIRDLSPRIEHVKPERVREELTKWLVGPHRERGLDLLDESGLLARLLPEISALKGVEQPPQFHPEGDVFVHTRMMLEMLNNPSETLAWSVLLHDIGKPSTYLVDENGRIRFNMHESVGEEMAKRLLTRLRFSNHDIDWICVCVAHHMAFKDVPRMKTSTLKRMLARPSIVEELELHRVDCLSSHGIIDIYEAVKNHLKAMGEEQIRPKPLLNGKDVLAAGMPPSPDVGLLLTEAYDIQLEGGFTDREAALVWLEQRLIRGQPWDSRGNA